MLPRGFPWDIMEGGQGMSCTYGLCCFTLFLPPWSFTPVLFFFSSSPRFEGGCQGTDCLERSLPGRRLPSGTQLGAAKGGGTPPPRRCVRVAFTLSNKASIAQDALTGNSPQSASADCRRSTLPQLTTPTRGTLLLKPCFHRETPLTATPL